MAALVNPIAHVVEGLKPVSSYDSQHTDLNLKHQGALLALRRGVATRSSIGILINMSNIVEALWSLGFGAEYEEVAVKGQHALLAIARRGEAGKKYLARGEELQAVIALLELHDAQMSVITVRELDQALSLVKKAIASKRYIKIIGENAHEHR